MKYQFSVTIYESDQFPDGIAVTKEIDAHTHADACYQGRHIMFEEIPDLVHRGILPETVLVSNQFDLEEAS
jgi:hypothetical protein